MPQYICLSRDALKSVPTGKPEPIVAGYAVSFYLTESSNAGVGDS